MARARAINGLDPARPYSEAAQRIVAVRAAELAEHSGDVLDLSDIERVHDMRVATRRLRAALEAFEPCFPARLWRSTLKDVKRLACLYIPHADGLIVATAREKLSIGTEGDGSYAIGMTTQGNEGLSCMRIP